MKTERRHELQTNALADWLGRSIENVRPYSTGIVGGVVLVVVAMGAYTYWKHQTRTSEQRGWEQLLSFSAAGNPNNLEDVADTFPNALVGIYARLQLANVQLNNGIYQLFTDRAEGKDQLNKAVVTFETIKNEATDPFLQQHALYGLARAHESLDHLEEAEKYYQELRDKWSDGVYSTMASRRLADLNRRETKEFYDWFEAQEPVASITGGPGQPGTRLPFDPDSLPGEPGDQSPFESDSDSSPSESSPEPSDEPTEEETSEETSADDSAGEALSEQPADETPAEEKTADEAAAPDEASPASTEEPEEAAGKPE